MIAGKNHRRIILGGEANVLPLYSALATPLLSYNPMTVVSLGFVMVYASLQLVVARGMVMCDSSVAV